MVGGVPGLRKKSPLGSRDLVFRLTRTSPTPPELDAILSRAGSFASAVATVTDKHERVTLLTARTDRETVSYIITPGQGNNSHVVTNLSSALGAKAVSVDDPNEIATVLDSACASFLVARPNRRASFATQSGGNPNEVAVLLSQLLQPGMWVAITLRKPSGKEQERVRKWVDHRREANSPSHYSNQTNLLVATFYAGAATQSDVAALLTQIVSAIPGFDIETRPFTSASRVPLWSAPLVGIVLGAIVDVKFHHSTIAWLAGAGVAVIAAVVSFIPPPGAGLNRELRATRPHGILPIPERRSVPPRGPVKLDRTNDKGQVRHIDRAGDYPLAPASFLINAPMAVGVVSPHSGSRSVTADTEYRSVPSELLDNVGPIVGYADAPGPEGTAVPVHIDAREMFGGVGALGLPGTGKTTLLHQLWAWHVLERVEPSGRPGYPGESDALIAFESKGDGTRIYERWSDVYGDKIFVVEVADPSTPAILVFNPDAPPREQARLFVSAMKYAWDESAIQALATETLNAVFTASITIMDCAPDVAAATQSITDGEVTFMSIAHLLLGGGGSYDDAKQIAANLTSVGQECPEGDPRKPFLATAVAALATIFGPDTTLAKWRDAVSSSRNKVDLLMGVPHWWANSRQHGSWKDILTLNRAIVINSGVSRSGDMLDDDAGTAIAAMTAYALMTAIKQNCSGWEEQERYVSIFADEISVLAKSSSEVIQWFREQGRAYGVRPFIAAQWPDQLPPKVRAAFMSFATLFWFQQSDHEVIADGVGRLSVNGGEWNPSDIANLAKYQAIVHATADGKLRMATTVHMAYWTDAEAFARDQGYV
jgi:hypothetical protein